MKDKMMKTKRGCDFKRNRKRTTASRVPHAFPCAGTTQRLSAVDVVQRPSTAPLPPQGGCRSRWRLHSALTKWSPLVVVSSLLELLPAGDQLPTRQPEVSRRLLELLHAGYQLPTLQLSRFLQPALASSPVRTHCPSAGTGGEQSFAHQKCRSVEHHVYGVV